MIGYILSMLAGAWIIMIVHGVRKKKPIGTIRMTVDPSDGSQYLFLDLDKPLQEWSGEAEVLVKVDCAR